MEYGGLVSDRVRERMVARLREDGIRDEVVLSAMSQVERHRFISDSLFPRAYDNVSLPIGEGQTISQPFIVARMLELLRNGKKLEQVLEIGTGCGYQAALLSLLATRVYSVERLISLFNRARRNLRAARAGAVYLRHGDGFDFTGLDLSFDGIVMAAATHHVPPTLLEHLNLGARLVYPHSDGQRQWLRVIERNPTGFAGTDLEDVLFVPLLRGT